MNQMLIHKTAGKSIVLICLLLLVQTSLVWAADEITGDWEITMDDSGRQSFATLSISRNPDGTLTGKWGSGELSDVKFQDGKLTCVRKLTVGDIEFSMNYSATLKDGRLRGTLSGTVFRGSDPGGFPANGTRKKPKLPVLGHWDIKFNVGDRQITGRLTISQKPDGTLQGNWASARGTTVISNVKFEDGKLSYHRKSTFGDREYESDFDGTVSGHKLTGAFKSQRAEMPATGERLGADLVGKWELTSTSSRGTYTSALTIHGDLTGSYESFVWEIPVKDLKLEGDQVSFGIEAGRGDRSFTWDFKGKLDGKALKGQMTSSRGTSDVIGKKVEPISAFVGTWQITRESSRGTRTDTLKINPDMTGTYTSRDTEVKIMDLSIEADEITFKVTMRYGDTEVPAVFKGRLDGTRLTGERTTSRGTSKFTGKRID